MLIVDRDAPVVARAELVVPAAPSHVFAVLADVANWPSWQSEVAKVQSESDVSTGSSFTWWSGGMKITSVVEDFDAPTSLSWRGRAFGTRALHTWRLTPHAQGCRVITEESMAGPVPRIARRVVRRMVADGLAMTLQQLSDAAARKGSHAAAA